MFIRAILISGIVGQAESQDVSQKLATERKKHQNNRGALLFGHGLALKNTCDGTLGSAVGLKAGVELFFARKRNLLSRCHLSRRRRQVCWNSGSSGTSRLERRYSTITLLIPILVLGMMNTQGLEKTCRSTSSTNISGHSGKITDDSLSTRIQQHLKTSNKIAWKQPRSSRLQKSRRRLRKPRARSRTRQAALYPSAMVSLRNLEMQRDMRSWCVIRSEESVGICTHIQTHALCLSNAFRSTCPHTHLNLCTCTDRDLVFAFGHRSGLECVAWLKKTCTRTLDHPNLSYFVLVRWCFLMVCVSWCAPLLLQRSSSVLLFLCTCSCHLRSRVHFSVIALLFSRLVTC